MSRLFALALNTFREAVRDRVLYSILFFGVGVILLSLAMEEITIGDQAKVVRSVGQGAIDGFGTLIAMFLGVSLVWKELTDSYVGDDATWDCEAIPCHHHHWRGDRHWEAVMWTVRKY